MFLFQANNTEYQWLLNKSNQWMLIVSIHYVKCFLFRQYVYYLFYFFFYFSFKGKYEYSHGKQCFMELIG